VERVLLGRTVDAGYGRAARRERVDEAERVRTLYVALTRAKRRLVMAGCFDGTARTDSHAALVRATRGPDLDAARDRAIEAGVDVWDTGPLRVRFLGRSEAPVAAAAADDPASVAPTRTGCAGGRGARDAGRGRSAAQCATGARSGVGEGRTLRGA
jgi:hypothetical protein